MLAINLAMLESEEEQSSLAEIYEKHKTEMLVCALRITRNKEMAEDAVHNAFLSIIKHKDKLLRLSGKTLRTQIIVITKNKCIDLLRKHNYYANDSIDDMENILVTNDVPIENQIIIIDEYEALRKHITSLDEVSRLVLEMKYILEMTYKEISEETGMTVKHVDTKIMRAKAKVRKLIAEGGVSFDKH